MKQTELVAQAMRQLPDLEGLEERLEKTPHAVLATAFPAAEVKARSPAEVGLEGMPEILPPDEVQTAVERRRERMLQAGKRAVSKVRTKGKNADLDPEEERGLEAIILLVGRPALLIQNGRFFDPPDEWKVLEGLRDKVQQTFPSVGRIEVTGHPAGMDWIGTGFLVGDNVVMTNRHVAKEFCRMDGRKWGFEPGMTARIDYVEELGATASAEYKLTGVIGVHEKFDLALFKASPKSTRGAKAPRPLALAAKVTAMKTGHQVYVVGYPASDSRRNDPVEMRRIFANIYDVKRLQPGEVRKVLNAASLFHHDCSTLGGNSGSSVVDLETHQVIGLHFSGRYLEANQAVALWKLAKDPLLKKAKVNFA